MQHQQRTAKQKGRPEVINGEALPQDKLRQGDTGYGEQGRKDYQE
jgi:hypothetical protein